MGAKYVLEVYISGMTPVTEIALNNLRRACRELEAEGEYQIDVIDITKRPELAEKERILATPTTIKKLPPPIRRVVGDLSEHESVIVSLDLRRA